MTASAAAPGTAAPASPAAPPTARSACRFCGAAIEHVVADLGLSPLANAYVEPERLGEGETFYPLRALVCGGCFLVQLEEFASPDAIFSDYAYFSSYSTSWLEHCRRYAQAAIERLGLGPQSHVVEVASNDGYLLRFFAERGVPVLGVEPAANVAEAARAKGIPTLVRFFGRDTARELAARRRADLIVGNNVLAHVPDLNDFVAGLKQLLAPGGEVTMEFPHLLRLIEERQFDTIYHEHFSYFSFLTARRVFAAHGLRLYDVEELPTHGGSLRIHAAHEDDPSRTETARAAEVARREEDAGLRRLETYAAFAEAVREEKRDILSFLIDLKRAGRTVVAYGAAAKGSTLLNYCGIGTDLVEYVVDRSPHKQGRYLPGSRIPIRAPEAIAETRPDVILILPWNLREEVQEQLAFVSEWGGRFAARAPALALLP